MLASFDRVNNEDDTKDTPARQQASTFGFIPKQEHFEEAMIDYKPAALKSVKLFTSDVKWSDVGGLDDVRQTLKDTLQLPTLFAPLFSRAPIKLPSEFAFSVHRVVERLCWQEQWLTNVV